jgi:hypothetical protein
MHGLWRFDGQHRRRHRMFSFFREVNFIRGPTLSYFLSNEAEQRCEPQVAAAIDGVDPMQISLGGTVLKPFQH